MKKVPAALTLSSLALLLSSLGQVVYADNIIDAPRAVSLVSFESTGRTTLVAAGADISIRNLDRLPDGRRVRLNGTVERVQGKHDFILRDESGRIEITHANASAAIKKGMDVTVSGRINRGILGSNINAHSVVTHSKGTQASLEKVSPEKASNAAAYTVQTLPETGLVKISGTVITSQNDREFVLKDGTGLVDVNVAAGNASNVVKGAHVTVVGLVDRGVLGKDITASTIIVERTHVASAE